LFDNKTLPPNQQYASAGIITLRIV